MNHGALSGIAVTSHPPDLENAANCGGRFVVAEMNGFVVHLCRNEKVFHTQA